MMSVSNEIVTTGAASATSGGTATRLPGGKFLTFYLAGEEYGIEILKVHEIIGIMPITPVPRTPEFIVGVINLRGKVITIINLRLKFGMPVKELTDKTCIIVVQMRGVEIGIMVDHVSEVVDIASKDIEDTPAFGYEVDTGYILGIGKLNDRVRLLLDIDKVLSTNEVREARPAIEEES